MTNKLKLEMYDSVVAVNQKNELALHDLVNGRFSKPVKLDMRAYDGSWDGLGVYRMRMSDRAMPLFLVTYTLRGQSTQVVVYTESEIDQMYIDNPASGHCRMLENGKHQLMKGLSK